MVSINDAISSIEDKPEFLIINLENVSDYVLRDRIIAGFATHNIRIYDYEKVKNDDSKIEYDQKGNIVRIKSGYIVEVELEEYSQSKAKMKVKVWSDEKIGFQNEYEATYKDNKWLLTKQKGAERKEK